MTGIEQFLAITSRMLPAARPGYAYRGMNDFLKVHGQAFPLAANQTIPGRYYPTASACFSNAYRLALRWPTRYRYVEGLAACVFPVHHAWCINTSGEVVDPTWDRYAELGAEYFGVIIPLAIAQQVRHRRNHSIIDAWERQWPLFRQPWPIALKHNSVTVAK